MRVWELADELGVTSADILDLIRPHDAYVTSHLAAVPRQALDAIRAAPPPPRSTWDETQASDGTPAAADPFGTWVGVRSAPGPRPGTHPRRYRRRPGPKRISFEPPYEEDGDGYGNNPTDDLRYELLWSTRDVATFLRVSPATVRQWVKRGHLQPCGQRGPSHIFERDDVLAAVRDVAGRRKRTGFPARPRLAGTNTTTKSRQPHTDAELLAWATRRRPRGHGTRVRPDVPNEPLGGVSNAALNRLAAVVPDALLTTAETAALVGLTSSTIRTWARRGHLNPVTQPSSRNDPVRRYYRLADAYAAARRPRPRTATTARTKGGRMSPP